MKLPAAYWLITITVMCASCASLSKRAPDPWAGLGSDKAFQKLQTESMRDSAFKNASIREIAKTYAVLFGKKLDIDSRLNSSIDVPAAQPETVGNAWKEFVKATRAQGLAVEADENVIKV